uniref:Uncharacterized protein n=1 Tax=Arundo donax TaxID=35708 RepID=A0A0A9GJY1_ARUDO
MKSSYPYRNAWSIIFYLPSASNNEVMGLNMDIGYTMPIGSPYKYMGQSIVYFMIFVSLLY